MDIRTGLVYNHTGHDITSYFRSAFRPIKVRKKRPKLRLRQLWVEFYRGFAFCLTHQPIGELLVKLLAPQYNSPIFINSNIMLN